MNVEIEDYVPVDIIREAENFVKMMDDDVKIYKHVRNFKDFKQSEEADKFVAYWWVGRYADFPHALALLYENKNEIDSRNMPEDSCDALEKFQNRFVEYYRLLKENGMIAE